MKEDVVKRQEYWIVEVVQDQKVLYHGKFQLFGPAWDKYQSFKGKDLKGKASVMLQRRFREYKIA